MRGNFTSDIFSYTAHYRYHYIDMLLCEWYWVKNAMMILNTSPEMTTTDLTMTTSRGRDPYEEMPLLPVHDTINPIFSLHPGSSFTFLTATTIEITNHSPYPNRNMHVYFIADLIDLSEKITDTNYREYICNDSSIDSFTNMRNFLDDTQEKYQHRSHTMLCNNNPDAHWHQQPSPFSYT